MKTTFLDFEQPIAELEAKIEELRFVQDDSAVDISDEIARLEQKNYGLTKDIYAKLTPWQVARWRATRSALHARLHREHIFTDFEELHGDRSFADDKAIVGGLARFNGQPVHGHRPPEGARHQREDRLTAISACRAPRAIARRCA
jgi:acetyl-CoA carboxylase carboxyl transferase subunit alpha